MEKSTFIVDFPSKHGDFPVRYVSHYQGVPSTNLQFAHAADCTVAIYLDVEKALAMGIKLFRSSNDVAPRQLFQEPDASDSDVCSYC